MAFKRINWTKIFMISVIALLISGIGWIAGSVISQYDVTRYEDSVDVFFGNGIASGTVIAVYNNQKVLLNQNNFQAMRNLLTITERQKISSSPSIDGKESITVTIDEDNYFIIYMLDEDADVFLHTCFGGRIRNFLVDGPKYRIFARALKYITPEGVYGTNELIP